MRDPWYVPGDWLNDLYIEVFSPYMNDQGLHYAVPVSLYCGGF